MSQHIFIGPQGEPLTCSSELEARALEARSAGRRPRRLVPNSVNLATECPTCGRPFVEDDDKEDEQEDEKGNSN
jgi:hypothetical protein